MRSKSKQKGSAFERKICKALSLWISGSREDLFWRSAMSGGRATLAGKKAQGQAGDICAIDPLGHKLTDKFYIECKNYEDLNFDSYIYDNKGILASMILENHWKAAELNKTLMLVFKENRRPEMVLFNTTFYLDRSYVITNNLPPNPFIIYKLSDILSLDFGKFLRMSGGLNE